eukprot:m.165961 g.165961  ORF g.165961 m.165961 type:complete len:321 (-) comp24024_c1_seq2:5660-6622(-)
MREHRCRWQTADLHVVQQEVLLRLGGKEGPPSQQLDQDAPQAPHVNRSVVPQAQHDLGCTVVPRLDVRVHLAVLEARRAKVDDADVERGVVHQQDVLWLEIGVDNAEASAEFEAGGDRRGDVLGVLQVEPDEVPGLELGVEVVEVQIEREAEVVPKVERINHPNKLVPVRVFPECVEHVDLDLALVVEPSLVPDDLDSHAYPSLVIDCLVHVTKRSFAQLGLNLVSVSDVVADGSEVPGVFVIVATVAHAAGKVSLGWHKVDLVKGVHFSAFSPGQGSVQRHSFVDRLGHQVHRGGCKNRFSRSIHFKMALSEGCMDGGL